MNEKQDSLSEKAEAAFLETAAIVVRQAKQTGTPVVVWENGQVKEIPSEDMEQPTSRYPTKPSSQ
jgi:hypothetical protein